MADRSAASSGRLVVLVGPDGVGKTTVARALIEQHGAPSAYFHFLPPIQGRLTSAPGPDLTPPPKARPGGWVVLGWIRILRNAARWWLAYVKTVRPAVKAGCLVVGDRGMYGYLVQPDALKFRGPHRFARAIVRLLPAPDLVVNLSAPADLVRRRKEELSLEQIEGELHAWASLDVPKLLTVDSTRPPRIVASEILVALASDGRGSGRWT